MKEISSEIDIDVSPERIWEILSDFAAYPEWNPFMREIDGEGRAGSRLRVRLQPPGSRAMTFKPKLLAFEPGREMRWFGRLWIPGLFNGEHMLNIDRREDGGVRFRQAEKFTGILVPFVAKTLRATLKGFEAMNQALKERAEGRGAMVSS